MKCPSIVLSFLSDLLYSDVCYAPKAYRLLSITYKINVHFPFNRFNRMKDYISIAPQFGISHIIGISQSGCLSVCKFSNWNEFYNYET
jgi:hypothetical protein